jgi:hypothetical protein
MCSYWKWEVHVKAEISWGILAWMKEININIYPPPLLMLDDHT